MMARIAIRAYDGALLFEHEAPDNTIKRTLEAGVGAQVHFRRAILVGVDLTRANLVSADLAGANLRRANLRMANLLGADLQDTNFEEADLWGADLSGTNLRGADLQGANLRAATLRGADLQGTDFWGANLRGALLQDTKNAGLIQARTSIVPERGAFHGFKLLRDGRLAYIAIPDGVPRSNATGRQCRAQCVDVLAIWDHESTPVQEGRALHDGTLYQVGTRVHCHAWDTNRWNECGGGIHFYLTQIEAKHHQ